MPNVLKILSQPVPRLAGPTLALGLLISLALPQTVRSTANPPHLPQLVHEFPVEARNHNYVRQILIHPQNPKFWLILTETGLYLSQDHGQTFSRQRRLVSHVAWHPTEPNIIYLSESFYPYNILKTTNFGQTWQTLEKPRGQPQNLFIDQTHPNTLYFANITGHCVWEPFCKIYQSQNAGQTWRAVSDIALPNFYVSPANGNLYTAAYYEKTPNQLGYAFYASTNQGQTFTQIPLRNPGPLQEFDLVKEIREDLLGRLYLTTFNQVTPPHTAKIFQSSDSGQTWQEKTNGLPVNSVMVDALLPDPQNPQVLYAALASAGIFKSTDSAQTWQKIADLSDFAALNPPRAIFSLSKDQDILYLGTDLGQIFKLTDKATPPTRHPVIFIHGLGGKPEDWISGNKKMYWERLQKEGWPEDYKASYAYADYNHDGKYDYQGDITKIDDDLPALVNKLAGRYRADGGNCTNGCVDLVGFSLGGIVAREYLNEHPFDHKVRKLITIGSPHRGSFVLEPKNWLRRIGIRGTFFEATINVFAEAVVNTFLRSSNQPLDATAPALEQITPGSGFLDLLNSSVIGAKTNDFLYGKIDAKLHQKLFFFDLNKEFSLGDGLILEDSATDVPLTNKRLTGFSDTPIFDMQLSVAENKNGFTLLLDTLDLQDFRFYHENLIRQPEVIDRVFSILNE